MLQNKNIQKYRGGKKRVQLQRLLTFRENTENFQ